MTEPKAGRELDAEVAKKVMGLTVEFVKGNPAAWEAKTGKPMRWLPNDYMVVGQKAMYRIGTFSDMHVPNYSTDIAAAWEVVEKMKADGYTLELDDRRAGWAAVFIKYGGTHETLAQIGSETVIDKSAPRALVLAALKAVGGQK